MTKSKALVLAAFTVWPIVYLISFMALIAYMTLFMRGEPHSFLAFIIVVHLLTMLETVALVVYYLAHVFREPAVPPDKKALWAVVIFFGNALAMPVYWWLFVWMPLNEQAKG